jgi:uncharacterized RDD family membrane protein YckC
MTWQDPNAAPGSGGTGRPDDDASLDETRTDWAPVTPPPTPEAPAEPPAGQPPAGQPSPWAPPPGQGYPPTTTSYDALGQPYTSPTPGYAPPGMTWAPPPELVQTASGMRFADVGPRFAAWIVDWIVLGVLTGLASVPIFFAVLGDYDWDAFVRSAAAGGSAFMLDSQFLTFLFAYSVVSTVLQAAYFIFLWSSGGRATLGMRLLKLQVGNAADGATLSIAQAFKRWLAMGYWLTLLGGVPLVGSVSGLVQFVWWIVLLVTTNSSPTRQGSHDRFAGTAVVQTGPAANPWVVGCGAVLIAFLASMVLSFLLLGALVSAAR